jgi:hypothetical protein
LRCGDAYAIVRSDGEERLADFSQPKETNWRTCKGMTIELD